MKTINEIVGSNLKKIREIAKFTQDQIAQSIGIERSTYSNYEAGLREVPYETLQKISDLLGCEPIIFYQEDKFTENEILVTAFRISNLTENDLKQVAYFKDIVKSYLKMQRILAHESN